MLVLGIDPGIAVGKPIAMAVVDTEGPEVLWWCGHAMGKRGVLSRYVDWIDSLHFAILADKDCRPGLVAIEQARGPGGSAHALQTLVQILCEECEALGIPWVLVHNLSLIHI